MPHSDILCDKCVHTKHTGVCEISNGQGSTRCMCPGSTFDNTAATVTSISRLERDCYGFGNVLDGARHEDDLPELPTSIGWKSEGGSSLPDWTDDRLYRLADECEHFVEIYRAGLVGWPTEARDQLAVIYDLINEDGR